MFSDLSSKSAKIYIHIYIYTTRNSGKFMTNLGNKIGKNITIFPVGKFPLPTLKSIDFRQGRIFKQRHRFESQMKGKIISIFLFTQLPFKMCLKLMKIWGKKWRDLFCQYKNIYCTAADLRKSF